MESVHTSSTASRTRRLPGWAWAAAAVAIGAAAWLLSSRHGTPEPTDPPTPRTEAPSAPSERLDPTLLRPGGTLPRSSAGRTPSAAPTAPAEVRGVVLDESGRPIAGADLVLSAVDPAAVRGVPFADGERLASARTERDGTFALPAPRAALARLTVSAPGRATAAAWVEPAGARLTFRLPPEAVLVVEVLDAEGSGVADAEVEVQVGRVLVTARPEQGKAEVRGLPEGAAQVRAVSPTRGTGSAGPLSLRAGERVEALLLLAPATGLAGRVLDGATDAPVAGALVLLARPGRSVAAPPTDAAGRFRVPDAVAVGERLQLSISAEGYLTSLEPWFVEAAADDRSEHVFRLVAAAAWVGRVEDSEGRPVEGARVAYTSDGIVGRSPTATVTDAQGAFRLPAPPPPAPGRRVVLTAQGPGGRAALALRPDVEAPDPLVLRLQASASVRGLVRGPDGAPLPGVLARLQPAWDVIADRRGADLLHAVNSERAGGATALSGSDGAWELPEVPTGTWRLTLERGGASRRIAEAFPVAAQDVDLGVATLGGGLAVHGRVLASDGRPVPDAAVRIRRSGPGGSRTALEAQGTVTSDVRGEYAFMDLAAGAHRLEAQAGPGARATATVDLEAPDTALDLVLPAPASLAFEVQHDSAPYRGLLRLTLRATNESLTPVHRASLRVADGRGDLHGLPEGKLRLEVEAAGGLVLAERSLPLVELRAGATTTVRLTLSAAARITGILLDAAGAPVRAGSVGTDHRESRVDDRGRFALAGLRPGEYLLTAEGRGGAPVRQRVEAVTGSAQQVEIRLAPAGTLAVRVRDASGRPVPGALLSFRPADRADGSRLTGEPRPVRTDPAGRAQRADLPPIAITVRARTEQGEGTAQATVRAGDTTPVEVTLNAR